MTECQRRIFVEQSALDAGLSEKATRLAIAGAMSAHGDMVDDDEAFEDVVESVVEGCAELDRLGVLL